jgi:hypothetical protein
MKIKVFYQDEVKGVIKFWEANGYKFVKVRPPKWYESDWYDYYLEFVKKTK